MTKYLIKTSFKHIVDGATIEFREGDTVYCMGARGYDYLMIYKRNKLTVSKDFVRAYMKPIKGGINK